MKQILMAFVLLSSISISHAAEVQENDGIYWQRLDGYGGLLYEVDVVTQQCFAVFVSMKAAGMTSIACADLAKRPEWKKIITWVD